MSSRQRPVVSKENLSAWCEAHFESPLRDIVFETGYSSAVFGIVLGDDRHVVAKIRTWHERLMACWHVHRHMWEANFPCPEPLGPPKRYDALAISFERYLPGGAPLPRGLETAEKLGRVLAELVKLAPPAKTFSQLTPAWSFLRWNDPGDAWPPATDIAEDLNLHHDPPWIEQTAMLARAVIRESKLPPVIGHGDWWSDNVRWENGHLLAVDDWDSIVALPEPALAGVAAALFSFGQSTVEESAVFLDAYIAASGQNWNTHAQQIAWAAGLWARLFDARKESIRGVFEFANQLEGEAEERLHRAGRRLQT